MVKKLTVAALAVLFFLFAFAGTEPTTTINGTLTNQYGETSAAGTITCDLSEAGTWDNDGTPDTVTTPVTGSMDGDGTVSLVLTPNDSITPAGTYWSCYFEETGISNWREYLVVPTDPDPVAISAVPRRVMPPPTGLSIYDMFINRRYGYPNEFQYDANGDMLWDISLYDDGNSGIILRNGYGFIQFGVGARLKIKLCGLGADAGFFYDEDNDDTYDAADDFCWGLGGYDKDCDCNADAGGSGDMLKADYDADLDGTVDYAEGAPGSGVPDWAKKGIDSNADGTNAAVSFDGTEDALVLNLDEDGTSDYALYDPRTVDSNGDGTVDLDVVGAIGGKRGDATNKQRFAIFPGGYSADPFDYTTGFVAENDSVTGYGAFYPIVSDPNYAALSPSATLGTSSYPWKSMYLKSSVLEETGYTSTSEVTNWSSAGFQQWIADNDYDSVSTRYFEWKAVTDDNADGTSESRTLMVLGRTSSPIWSVNIGGVAGLLINEISYNYNSYLLSFNIDDAGSAEVVFDGSDNSVTFDLDGDGTLQFDYDSEDQQLCLDPDDNGNCDFIFKDYGTDPAPVVGIAFHGSANPTIRHDENNKLLNFDYDEDGTYDLTLDGSALQVTMDADSDGTTDLLLNKAFMQTDQIRYSTDSAARMTATNGRMHMCGGNQFAPVAAAGACMYLGGSTGGYASTIGFDPDGDGTTEATINNLGEYSGKASTAGALSTDPSGCTLQFVTDIAAAGALTCNSVTGAYITDGTLLEADLTWNSTATRSSGQGIVVAADTTKFDVVTLLTASSSDVFTNKTYDAAASGNVFTIEDAAAASAASAGQIKIDTTANQLVYYGGAGKVLDPRQVMSFNIIRAQYGNDPTVVKLPYGITVSAIHCIVGAATNNVVSVEECDATGASCAGLDGSTTVTCDTDGATDDGSLSNAALDTGDWIKLNFGTETGTTNYTTVTIFYTITQE